MLDDPRVSIVEENAELLLSQLVVPSSPQTNMGPELWGLDRIDDRQAPGDTTYEWQCPGTFIRVYVIDTGIRQSHTEFTSDHGGTKVMTGADFADADEYPDSQTNPCVGATGADALNGGHGTAVASIIAGNTYGVAKRASLVPVRVINCKARGEIINAMNGLEWVYNDYDLQTKPAVVNLSFGFRLAGPPPNTSCWLQGASAADINALETQIGYLINSGVTVVTAAGNQNVDASYLSPARMSNVITVGGTMQGPNNTDRVWVTGNPNYSACTSIPPPNLNPGSNWGASVKIWAPATDIISAHITSDTDPRPAGQRTGTSFAAPFVAGVAARYLQAASKSPLWPSNVLSYLQNNATAGVLNVDGLQGAPNLFLYAPFACRF